MKSTWARLRWTSILANTLFLQQWQKTIRPNSRFCYAPPSPPFGWSLIKASAISQASALQTKDTLVMTLTGINVSPFLFCSSYQWEPVYLSRIVSQMMYVCNHVMIVEHTYDKTCSFETPRLSIAAEIGIKDTLLYENLRSFHKLVKSPLSRVIIKGARNSVLRKFCQRQLFILKGVYLLLMTQSLRLLNVQDRQTFFHAARENKRGKISGRVDKPECRVGS